MKKSVLLLVITLLISILSIPTGVSASEEIYKKVRVLEGENLDLESSFPNLASLLREQLGDRYDLVRWNSVTETKSYFTLDENNELSPVTNGDIGILSACQPHENNCSYNYGITIWAVGGDFGNDKIVAGSFEWDNSPPLSAGNSVDGFTLNWAGNLAIKDYQFNVSYNGVSETIAPSVITPNQGIGIEFKEAINRTWPLSDRYVDSGGAHAILAGPSINLGRSANAVATYLHTSTSTSINSLGISIDGGSIGWTTTTTVQSVAAVDHFTY